MQDARKTIMRVCTPLFVPFHPVTHPRITNQSQRLCWRKMVYFGPYGVPIKRTTGKYVICPQTILVLQKLLLKYTPTLEQKLFADSVALVFKKKGAEICELSSQLRILVKESQSMWKHSCQKCTRQIFSSQKFLFDLKQNLNDLCTSISSVKRLKSCSTRVSVKDHLTRPG